MKYQSENSAASFGMLSTKSALLYYDKVFPLYFLDNIENSEEIHAAKSFFRNHLTGSLLAHWDVITQSLAWKVTSSTLKKVDEQLENVNPKIRERLVSATDDAQGSFQSAVLAVYVARCQDLGEGIDGKNRLDECEDLLKKQSNSSSDDFLDAALAFTNNELAMRRFEYVSEGSGFEVADESHESKSMIDPSFILTRLQLIDAGTISWPQIIEIRKDEESKKKLTRLRTFMFEEFSGKPLAYIEDKLAIAIEDYRLAANKHGAVLRHGALRIAASENLMNAAMAGFLSAVAGCSIPVSAAVGASALIAGAAVELHYVRRDQNATRLRNPVRYLIDLKNLSVE